MKLAVVFDHSTRYSENGFTEKDLEHLAGSFTTNEMTNEIIVSDWPNMFYIIDATFMPSIGQRVETLFGLCEVIESKLSLVPNHLYQQERNDLQGDAWMYLSHVVVREI